MKITAEEMNERGVRLWNPRMAIDTLAEGMLWVAGINPDSDLGNDLETMLRATGAKTLGGLRKQFCLPHDHADY